MYSTRFVLAALRGANPQTTISEEQVRRAIRLGLVPAPTTVAGRFLWTKSELTALASALNVKVPAIGQEVRDAQ